MAFVMPEMVMQKMIQAGMRELRNNKPAFDDLFGQLTDPDFIGDYGAAYRDEIWVWFTTTKIPVVQAWSFNVTRIPAYSIRLSMESEDTEKAAIGDIAADDESGELLTGVLSVNIDVGIHANKSGDHILWMYYILLWIWYRKKTLAEKNGLKLGTFSASDYNREPVDMGDNIWTRWIRCKATTQNFLGGTEAFEIEDVNIDPITGLPTASSISVSDDVDLGTVDPTTNRGVFADSNFDPSDDDWTIISEPTTGTRP